MICEENNKQVASNKFSIDYLLGTSSNETLTLNNNRQEKLFIDKKQNRTAFTQYQIKELENEFQNNHYLTIDKRCLMSAKLNLTENQIKIWFQNRRTKVIFILNNLHL